MKLSASNIGWIDAQDEYVYSLLSENGYSGLEIAPTRIFPDSPYSQIDSAAKWAADLKKTNGFTVPSMQSIWFGRSEKIFGSSEERRTLVDYTKKAIDFAAAIGCGNLVFGCPRNRSFDEGTDLQTGVEFFREIGDYAAANGTIVGMEANPPIYNTNYINDTASALELVQQVASDGFKLNLDIGTMIHNDESIDILKGKVNLISHVHISEPGLAPIEKRDLHIQLRDFLKSEGYDRYVSIEMGKRDDTTAIENAIMYVKEIFG